MSWFAAHQSLLQRLYRWLAVIVFILAAAQPVLGAFGFFENRDYMAFHEILANALFPLALLMLGLSIVAGFQRRGRMMLWSFILTALIVSQIGLGYSTRSDASLTAYHIPAGVLVFGVALLVVLMSYGMRLNRETA